jgi:hypothetical protein
MPSRLLELVLGGEADGVVPAYDALAGEDGHGVMRRVA